MKNFVAKMQSINLLKDSLDNPFFLVCASCNEQKFIWLMGYVGYDRTLWSNCRTTGTTIILDTFCCRWINQV